MVVSGVTPLYKCDVIATALTGADLLNRNAILVEETVQYKVYNINTSCIAPNVWQITDLSLVDDANWLAAVFSCETVCSSGLIRARITDGETICVDFRYLTYDPVWSNGALTAANAWYWVEEGVTGIYQLTDANSGSGTVSTCDHAEIYQTAVDINYNDPRYRTEYYLTRDMRCNHTTKCDFYANNMVLQPSGTVLTNTVDYYPYYTCQQNCDNSYFVLANGTCAVDAHCGVGGALTSYYVATKTVAAINT